MPKANDVAVMDIGSKKITVLIGEKSNKGIYNIKGFGECYYSGFSGGKWFKEDDLKSAVAKALNIAEVSSGIKIKKLYIGVPSEFIAVVCKEVSISKQRISRITDSDISSLYHKGDTYSTNPKYLTINYSAIYYTLDDSPRRFIEPRGLSAIKISALLSYILCERSFITLFEEIAQDLKLKEIEFISAIWAESMSLFEPIQRDKYIIIADIGYITSSVAVARGDGILHLSSFSLGGGHIESDIAMMFNVPFSIAKEVKSKIDISLDYPDDAFYEAGDDKQYRLSSNDVNEIAKARLDTFVELINESINCSEFDFPTYAVVHLTGGGVSQLRGVKEYMSGKLKKSIEIVSPDVPRFNKPYYSSVIGLIDIASSLNEKEATAITKIFKKLFSRIGG